MYAQHDIERPGKVAHTKVANSQQAHVLDTRELCPAIKQCYALVEVSPGRFRPVRLVVRCLPSACPAPSRPNIVHSRNPLNMVPAITPRIIRATKKARRTPAFLAIYRVQGQTR